MKTLLLIFVTHCFIIVHGYDDDIPRFFTNSHGGYQFFHAAEQQENQINRRSDPETSFSDTVNYVVLPQSASHTLSQPEVPKPEVPKPEMPKIKTTRPRTQVVKSVPKQIMNKLSDRSDDIDSSENRILKEKDSMFTTHRPRFRFTTPSSAKRVQVTRKRIIVRKFKPAQKAPQAEKNKKREISAATTGNHLASRSKIPHKYKFTNRNFKPLPKKITPVNTSGGGHKSLYVRRPSDTFMQLHYRKLDVTTSTTTASSMQGMKEKRHLANIRFFNRRKLRS